MNDRKRNTLKRVITMLENASDLISEVVDEEQDCMDNMPENLQCSNKYERMEEAVDYLSTALDEIETAVDNIKNASE